jgi:Tol biopolymer transport system component
VCTKVIDGVSQVIIVDVESGEKRQISHTGGGNFGGAWSRDGSRLAYATYKNDAARLAIIDVKGGPPVVFDSCVVIHHTEGPPISWAPSAKILYITSGSRTIRSFDPDEETCHLVGPSDSVGWKFTPVGSPTDELFAFYWVGYPRNIKAEDGPSPDQTGTWISSLEGENASSISKMSMPIGWSSDGEWVYTWRFVDRYLARVSIKTGAVDSLGTFPSAPRAGVSISPDAARVAYVMWESTADLWLVENIPEP